MVGAKSRRKHHGSDCNPTHVHDCPQSCSQEAGGNNSLWTGDASEWRCHSTSSSARATLEMKDATHPPAISIQLRPPKFRTQITLAVEHSQVAINSAE